MQTMNDHGRIGEGHLVGSADLQIPLFFAFKNSAGLSDSKPLTPQASQVLKFSQGKLGPLIKLSRVRRGGGPKKGRVCDQNILKPGPFARLRLGFLSENIDQIGPDAASSS